MAPVRMIEKYIENIRLFGSYDSLKSAIEELEKGKPVAVETDSGLKLLLPKDAVGFPNTRILGDLPLKDIPMVHTTDSIEKVESSMRGMHTDYSLVVEDKKLVGFVCLEELLIAVMEEAKKSISLGMVLGEILESERAIAVRMELPEDTGDVFTQPVEVYGSAEGILGFIVKERMPDMSFLIDLLGKAERAKLQDAIMGVVSGGSRNEITLPIRESGKSPGFLNISISQKYREGEKKPSILLFITDVTEKQLLFDIQETLSTGTPESSFFKSMSYIGERFSLAACLLISMKSANGSQGFSPSLFWVRPDFKVNFKKIYRNERERKRSGQSYGNLWRSVEGREIIYVSNIEEVTSENVGELSSCGIKSYLLIPCVTDGEEKVVVALLSDKKNGIDERLRNISLKLLPSFQGTAKAWIYEKKLNESKKLLEKRVRQRTYQLEVLYHVARSLGYSLSYEELLKAMVDYLKPLFDYDVVATLLCMEGKVKVNISYRRAITRKMKDDMVEVLIGRYEELTGKKIDRDNTVIESVDISEKGESRKLRGRGVLDNLKTKMLIPIKRASSGEVIGLFFVGLKRKRVFSGEEMELLETVSRQASLAIEKLDVFMQSEQKKLERIVEHLPDGIVILDNGYHIVSYNPKGEEFIRHLSGKRMGEKLEKLGNMNIEDLIRLSASEMVWRQISIEDPEKKSFMVRFLPISEGEKEEQWMLIIHDATKEMEILEKSKRQDLLASVGQLAAGIAHDFNNILTGIIGFSQFMQTKDDIPAYAKGYLKRMEQQGFRAVDLIQQILDFSRKTIVMKSNLDLVSLLKEIVKLLERTISEKIKIELNIEPEQAIIYSNPTQIQQIITNLAVNARDAMPGGGKLKIELKAKYSDEGKLFMLIISDTGTGMPDEIVSKIFTPFFTTKETGKGTGLGLSQVYGIVKQNGGEIEVESEPGKGTTFTIYLPAVGEEKESEEERESLLKLVESKNILLVEDEDMVRDSVKLMLEQLGFSVESAADGESALDIIMKRGEDIDVILTDIVMPGMGGVSFALKVKEIFPEKKIVAMSGYPLGSDETSIPDNDFRNSGFDGWIMKPVTMEKLSNEISSLFSE